MDAFGLPEFLDEVLEIIDIPYPMGGNLGFRFRKTEHVFYPRLFFPRTKTALRLILSIERIHSIPIVCAGGLAGLGGSCLDGFSAGREGSAFRNLDGFPVWHASERASEWSDGLASLVLRALSF